MKLAGSTARGAQICAAEGVIVPFFRVSIDQQTCQ
jgi:hypothetical protein